jgi:transposase
VELHLTAGQESDVAYAGLLLADHRPKVVIADKGYDSDRMILAIKDRGAEPVIPPLKCRKLPRKYNRKLYKKRNLAERFISRIKQYRRVATRFDKKAQNYLAFVQLASVMTLLR